MPSKLEWDIAILEGIASDVCECTQDSGDRCRVCEAAGTLNRINADASDSLKQIERK